MTAFLLTIAKAAREVGVEAATLRKYERLGLLTLARDSLGRRLFTSVDIAQAKAVHEERRANQGRHLRRGNPPSA